MTSSTINWTFLKKMDVSSTWKDDVTVDGIAQLGLIGKSVPLTYPKIPKQFYNQPLPCYPRCGDREQEDPGTSIEKVPAGVDILSQHTNKKIWGKLRF